MFPGDILELIGGDIVLFLLRSVVFYVFVLFLADWLVVYERCEFVVGRGHVVVVLDDKKMMNIFRSFLRAMYKILLITLNIIELNNLLSYLSTPQ